jgi:hypothetical protein
MKERFRFIPVWTEQGFQMRLIKEVKTWWWPFWRKVVVEKSCPKGDPTTRQT